MFFAWADSMISGHQLSVHSCLTPGRHQVMLTTVSFTHILLINSVICSLYGKRIPTKIYKGIGHINIKLNWPNLLSPQVDGFLEIQNQICFYLFSILEATKLISTLIFGRFCLTKKVFVFQYALVYTQHTQIWRKRDTKKITNTSFDDSGIWVLVLP